MRLQRHGKAADAGEVDGETREPDGVYPSGSGEVSINYDRKKSISAFPHENSLTTHDDDDVATAVDADIAAIIAAC